MGEGFFTVGQVVGMSFVSTPVPDKPLWRFQMSYGGVNSGVVIHDDTVIAIHGKENIDSSTIGRMVAIKKPAELPGLKRGNFNSRQRR